MPDRRFVDCVLAAVMVAVVTFSAHGQTAPVPSSPGPNSWPPPGVHTLSEPGITTPSLIHEVKPAYTVAAMRSRVQGTVTIMAVVQADGSVGAIRIVRALHPELDAQAVQAAQQWRFTPATLNGAPVPVIVAIDLSFKLKDEPPPSPSLAWPDVFPREPARMPDEDTWRDDIEHVDNLEIHIPLPADWAPVRGGDLVGRVSPDHRVLFSVGKPRPFPNQITGPLSAAQLVGLGTLLARSATSSGQASLASSGQVQTGSGFWLWFEMPVTIDTSDFPPELLGLPLTYDSSTLFMFAGTRESHLVQVSCGVLRQHGRGDAEYAKDKRDAGAVCARIIDRMTVTSQ